jgi:multiple sugar transport system permease protein
MGYAGVGEEPIDKKPVTLRAWGVPSDLANDVSSLATQEIFRTFQNRFPYIKLEPPNSLEMPSNGQDIVPLMQIAADISPDVMVVIFRQSQTYIQNKFLYPLDKYIEKTLGIEVKNSHILPMETYLARLKESPLYKTEMETRVPRQCWDVMRRQCPHGADCPYLKQWGEEPVEEHYHIWCFPEGPVSIALFYRKDLFAEAGLPDRVPKDWDELLDWSRQLTNPKHDQYGLQLSLDYLSWATLSFLYSLDGRIVEKMPDGEWVCTFDSEEAVDAYYFVSRLFLEPFENKHGKFSSVVSTDAAKSGELKSGMFFDYINQKFFTQYDPNQYGFGPVPMGPTGKRGSEFNCDMTGIYAGTAEEKRDAAWEYIRFLDSPEAGLVQAKVFVENGYGQFVRPSLLKKAGYTEYLRQIPEGWEEAVTVALKNGVPEPYGKNCQMVYNYVSRAIDQIRTDDTVARAIQSGDEQQAKSRIREILKERVVISNAKMLGKYTPGQQRIRRIVALAVTIGIACVFTLVFRRVFRIFTPDDAVHSKGWHLDRYKWCYLLLFPALGTIALWAYYPLLRGMVMAFQNYNIRGFSQWVGMDNFANVLFDSEFWFSMWVSFKYAFLFLFFGFGAPILLAFLLTEVPRGKVLFRTIYYLPAVLSGVIVIFLWKGFYGQYGMINQVLNFFISILNYLPGIEMAPLEFKWLEEPRFALFFCLLPVIWAGMGPGCLIYLAALKTVPEELYEAADIDGAGIFHKVFSIAIPSIKALIMINFIGAMIGAIKGGSELIMALTAGGPFTPYGHTEVIGLHIFWEAFGYLRFGSATAMAWILGSLLIGFTVLQLQKMSRLEFKAAGKG